MCVCFVDVVDSVDDFGLGVGFIIGDEDGDVVVIGCFEGVGRVQLIDDIVDVC